MKTTTTTHASLATALLALLLLAVPVTAQTTSDSMMTDDEAMMDDEDAMMDSDDSDGLSPWAIGIGAVVLAAIVAGIVLFVRNRGG